MLDLSYLTKKKRVANLVIEVANISVNLKFVWITI